MLATDSIDAVGIIIGAVVAIATVVIGFFTYKTQRRLAALEEEKANRERRDSERDEAAQRQADLAFELTYLAGRTLRLHVNNRGNHAAKDVEIVGDHSSGPDVWRHLTSFNTIPARSTARFDFTNHDWQVLGGSTFAIRVGWSDGNGEHAEEFVATLTS